MKSTLTSCLVVALCSLSVSAFAQSDPDEGTRPEFQGECVVDADCPTNFTCVTDTANTACPPCLDDGSACDACESQTYSYCMPPPPTPCTADSDCDGSDVCVSYTYEMCSGGVAPAIACDSENDEPCDIPPVMDDETTCETQTEAYCVPPYVAPCQAAADCGPGFTCEVLEQCSCTSSGSVGNGEDGQTEPAPDADCSCEPTDEQYCQVIVVECDTDADCAQDLSCISGPDEATVSTPTDSDTEPGDDAPGDDGASPMPMPEPSEPVSYCLPPGYGYWGETSGSDAVAQESGVNGAFSNSDRVSWGASPTDGGGSGKSMDDGCSTIEGDAALSLLGLFGLVGLFRRRR